MFRSLVGFQEGLHSGQYGLCSISHFLRYKWGESWPPIPFLRSSAFLLPPPMWGRLDSNIMPAPGLRTHAGKLGIAKQRKTRGPSTSGAGSRITRYIATHHKTLTTLVCIWQGGKRQTWTNLNKAPGQPPLVEDLQYELLISAKA